MIIKRVKRLVLGFHVPSHATHPSVSPNHCLTLKLGLEDQNLRYRN